MHRMERVTSRHNALVKRFRDLAGASRPGDAAVCEILLDGEHLVQEALACGVPIDVAAFSDRRLGHDQSPLAQLAADVGTRGGRSVIVTDQVLAAMSPVQHPSGVVAIASSAPASMASVFAGAAAARIAPALVLAGLQDPGNVGAIIRAAAAFGAAGVIAVEGTANPFAWKALRGAMGATFRLPVAHGATLEEAIEAATAHRVVVVGAVPRGGTPLPHMDLRRPAAILLGAEGAGISAAAVAAAHETVSIPMLASIESLNVAVAAALILYEATRQRGAS
ncbi:MAG: TrmH family RNA methyltransferase [Vicinamibacterales bacterium]